MVDLLARSFDLKIMPKIGRLGVRKRRKSITPAYNTAKNRPPGVRTPNSKVAPPLVASRLEPI